MMALLASEMVLPQGIFSGRRHQNNFRSRKTITTLLTKQSDVYNASKFKYDQRIYPDNSEARKLSVACTSCFPNHTCQLDEEVKISGIRNLFNIGTDYPGQYSWASVLSHVWHTGAASGKRVAVLNSQEILQDAIESLGEKCTKEQEEMLKIGIKQLILPFTGVWGKIWIFRLAGWILRRFFGKVSDGVCVHEGEVELLERAMITDLPVVYVPLNRSDLDPAVLFFTLQSLGLPSPYFLSTRSQRFWGQFIGGLGFRSGGKNITKRTKNALSIACFRNILKKRGSICVHLEQQRSRSGKPSLELYGIEFLDELYRYWISNEIEDAYIVPVNISYEQLPEHFDTPPFIKNGTNITIFKKMRNYLLHKLGLIRVNFGQPFTLREFQASTKTNIKFRALLEKDQRHNSADNYTKTYCGDELRWNSNLNPALSCSLSSIYGLEFHDDSKDDQFAFLDSLAFHTAFASMHCCTPMSTHFVAFLLLKKFRKTGVSLHQLFLEVRELQLWFVSYGKDVGFSGDIEKVVLHALDILGPDAFRLTIVGNLRMILPILSSGNMERLGYYANCVLQFMALEAVVAVALLTIVGNNLRITKEFDLDHHKVSDELLTGEVIKVYKTFTSEFFLHAPCLTSGVAIRRTYELLNERNLVQNVLDEVRSSKRFDSELDDNSEDEYIALVDREAVFIPYNYKVANSEEAYSTLRFLRSLLVPYMEIYAAIALELACLINPKHEMDKSVNDCDFMEKTLRKLKDSFSVEDYGELLTFDILKTACLAFESNGIIYYKVDRPSNQSLLYLTPEFESIERLRILSDDILHFVTY